MTPTSILLVEDHAADHTVTLRALHQVNIMNEVVVAHDREQALAHLFPEDAPLPQLVLLDLDLADAIETLRAIRTNERTHALPIVAVSSERSLHTVADAYAAGANSYVSRPLQFTAFADIMRHLGMYWLVLNTNPDRNKSSAA